VIYQVLNVLYVVRNYQSVWTLERHSHLSQRDRAHCRLHEVWGFLVVDLPGISDLYVSIATQNVKECSIRPNLWQTGCEGWVLTRNGPLYTIVCVKYPKFCSQAALVVAVMCRACRIFADGNYELALTRVLPANILALVFSHGICGVKLYPVDS
jgi:hypothetical protein